MLLSSDNPFLHLSLLRARLLKVNLLSIIVIVILFLRVCDVPVNIPQEVFNRLGENLICNHNSNLRNIT